MRELLRSTLALAAALSVSTTSLRASALGAPAPGSVSPETLKLPDGPASVRGLADDASLDVFSAQVHYEVPIALPSAAGGFAPKVSLSYEGALGNGPEGIGWSLSVPSIRRSVRQGVPSFTSADELDVLGVSAGGRLVAAADGTFRLEGHGNLVKVVPQGTGYVAYAGDGTTFTFGQTPQGQQADGAKTTAWLVESVSDEAGQTIQYTWQHDQGQAYIAKIDWGPSSAFEASFTYEARPDVTASYRSGMAVTTAQRLASITVTSFGEVLRTYTLSYDEGFSLSRLKQIAQTGRGGQLAMPPVTIGYAPAPAPVTTPLSGWGGWQLNQHGVSLLDVDGDGLSDLYQMSPGAQQWRRNLGGGAFGPAQVVSGATTAALGTARLLDVNGDTRADLVTLVSNAWHVSSYTSGGWQAPVVWTGSASIPIFGKSMAIADVNGDSRVDVVRAGSDGILVTLGSAGGLAPTFSRPPISANNGSVTPGASQVRLTDINGDGLVDAVWLTDSFMHAFLGRGDGTFADAGSTTYPWTQTFVDLPNTYVADLNRDGIVDLLRFSAGTLYWYRGDPGFRFKSPAVTIARPEAADYDAAIGLADVLGDGSTDVVWSSPRGTWLLDFAGSASASMVTSIDNGLGKTIAFDYSTSARLSAADAAAGHPWASTIATSLAVPVARTVHMATDPDRVTRWAVRDAFWDAAEQRFGGFLRVTETQGASPSATVITDYEPGYGNRRELRGQPLFMRTLDDQGQLLLFHTFTRDTITPPGLPSTPLALKPVLLWETEEHHEGLSTPVLTRNEFTYDAEGRVVLEAKLGRTDVTGDESTSFATWGSDDTTWVRDKKLTEGVQDAAGNVLRSKRFTYGDDTQVLPLGTVGKGWLRKTESLLVDPVRGQVWRDDEERIYDALGNLVQHFDGKVWRSRTYDANGLFAVQEQVTTGSTVIAWRATWDPVIAQPVTITGPNGETSYDTYDALGRLVARAHVQGSPYETVEYDWTAPTPTTVTRTFEKDEASLTPFTTWTPGSGWREAVAVTNGAGERLYDATRLTTGTYVVDHLTTRDALGRSVFEAEPFVSTGLPSSAPQGSPGGAFVYDALGRTVKHVLATGAAKTTQYAAFTVSTTTDGLVPVTTTLDGLGRVTHTERTVGTTIESVDATYDATGAITLLSLNGAQVQHSYTYDTLGRLVASTDPDNGARAQTWDDADQLVHVVDGAGSTVDFTYDDVARVTSMRGSCGRSFVYHYDAPKDGTSLSRALGRVAWIEEPTGEAHFAYDAEGRVAKVRRLVNGRSVEQTPRYAASGRKLGDAFDDGFAYDLAYDDAGRLVRAGDFWTATSLDARGAVLSETFGNGVTTAFTRDLLGQPSHVRTERVPGAAIYDVDVQRNAFGAITTLTDGDGVGLDHSGAFAYDGAGRVTQATIGSAQPYSFGFAYDSLQNLTTRTASGPTALGVLSGTYVYGENGRSPRQLTRVTGPAQGDVTFDYDAAGRIVREGTKSLVYDAYEELVQVLDSGAAVESHEYGYDGLRTWTQTAAGGVETWLASDVDEKAGSRDHFVDANGRTVAKSSVPLSALPAPDAGPIQADDAAPAVPAGAAHAGFGLLALAAFFFAKRRARAFVSVALLALIAACSSSRSDRVEATRAAWTSDARVYFHAGVAAGPAVFTRADATVEEERRSEPFGAPIDAYRESAGVSSVGTVDFDVESRNELNQETDPRTGWSYQGARWMDPAIGRWLATDPPTKGPDPKFLFAPWDLNPYQYARSNPLIYWDPDGQSWWTFTKGVAKGFAKAVVIGVGTAALATVAPVAGAVVGVGLLAYGGYQLYKGRHELAAVGHRVLSGTTTDADHEFFGELVGGVLGGKVGARVGVGLGKMIKPPPSSVGAAAAEAETACSGGACTGGKCFVAGTLVLTLHGLVPIEQIHSGDRVLSRDADTGEVAYHGVERTVVLHTDAVEDVDLAADDGSVERIVTTFEHPFWVKGRGWVEADALAPGDETLTATGERLVVQSVASERRDTDVYNFIVEGTHSYFVGTHEAWVHNGDCIKRYEGPKPRYKVNEAHDPKSKLFNPKKTPLPDDAEAVFKRAVPGSSEKPPGKWGPNWFGKNADGDVYRFSDGNDGTAHFSARQSVEPGINNLTDYAEQRLDALGPSGGGGGGSSSGGSGNP